MAIDRHRLNDLQARIVQKFVFAAAGFGDAPFRGLVLGGPGTGKTALVRVAMDAIGLLHRRSRVALLAYTGRAAVHLQGLGGSSTTTTSFFAIHPLLKDFAGADASAAAEVRLRDLTDMVVIDEISLVGVNHLALIEKRMRTCRPCARVPERLFGGCGLLLVGDFHQHRCIGDDPLYSGAAGLGVKVGGAQKKRARKLASAAVPHAAANLMLEGFEVFLLTESVRTVRDEGGRRLAEFLWRMNRGRLLASDLDELNRRVLGKAGVPGMEDALFDRAMVMTLRNATRGYMELPLLMRHARAHGQRLLTWSAMDRRIGNVDKVVNRLPKRGYFFKGMRVAIADRVSVLACAVRNNSATLLDIVYSGGPPVDTGEEVLSLGRGRMPLGVFAKIDGCDHVFIADRGPGVVFLRPWQYRGDGVLRVNLPYSPLATFTDFFAEGATIRPPDRVIMDLARPPTGPMTRASVLVAVSRVESWSEIYLLRALWNKENREYERARLLYTLMPEPDVFAFLYDMRCRAGQALRQNRAAVLQRYFIKYEHARIMMRVAEKKMREKMK